MTLYFKNCFIHKDHILGLILLWQVFYFSYLMIADTLRGMGEIISFGCSKA
jgi:hypothetical protein